MPTIDSANRGQVLRMQNYKKASPTALPTNGSKDTVEISSNTTLLAEAEEQANCTPDIDQAAVDKVRESLRNGEMEINFERLAQKMLDFELTLFDS